MNELLFCHGPHSDILTESEVRSFFEFLSHYFRDGEVLIVDAMGSRRSKSGDASRAQRSTHTLEYFVP